MNRVAIIDLIAGARPNFMKIASITRSLEKIGKDKVTYRLVHTGQHYDQNMSGSFFEQLNIPEPEINLGAGSGTQAEQTAAIMIGYERLLSEAPCDLCLVVGDVTSTMACAIVAQKAHIRVAHVEAGIRSGDWRMPEEINRRVTDSITNYFFTTSETATSNLLASGAPSKDVYFVGNTMIDTLFANLERLRAPSFWGEHGLVSKEYITLTMHRPSNVDSFKQLSEMLLEIAENSRGLPVVFPVHPRTASNLRELSSFPANIKFVSPQPYLEFIYLVRNSFGVITDSGGITEETTVLNIPCMTLRDTTERPETVTVGTNELLGTSIESIKPAMDRLYAGEWKDGKSPEKWDGKAGDRIAEILVKKLGQ